MIGKPLIYGLNLSNPVDWGNGIVDSRVKGELESLVLSQDLDGRVHRQDRILARLQRSVY